MRIAARMGTIGTESAFEVSARARALEAEGRSIVYLQIGEPDFDTPANVRAAAKAALDAGATHYPPFAGIPALREAIAADASARKGFPVEPHRVFVTVGGKGVMLYAILALVDPGDEVLVPDPGYPIYESLTRFVGATPVPIPIRMENDFRLDVDELASLITPEDARPRHQLAGQPDRRRPDPRRPRADRRAGHPPRPVGPRRRDLRADPVRRRRARLDRVAAGDGRADDRARRLLQDVRHDRLADGLRDRARVARQGLRPADHQHHQRGRDVRPGRRGRGAASGRRTTWTRWSSSSRPGATSSSTASTRSPGSSAASRSGRSTSSRRSPGVGLSGADLAERLLHEAGVCVLPGSAFGVFGDDHIRISYANSQENLLEALGRIRTFVEPLVAARV